MISNAHAVHIIVTSFSDFLIGIKSEYECAFTIILLPIKNVLDYLSDIGIIIAIRVII